MPSFSPQRGAALVTAIFVLVVIALLASAMIRVLQFGDDSVAREVLSSRALMAAESGLERSLSRIFPAGGGAANCSTLNWTFASAVEGLADCQVSVSCSTFAINGINYYRLESEGQCGPSSDPAVRRVQVQARDI